MYANWSLTTLTLALAGLATQTLAAAHPPHHPAKTTLATTYTTSSPSTPTSAAPQPTCTLTLLKQPSFDTNCTFYSHTLTALSLTDCGGCALTTRYLGVGLPCRSETTLPGTATATVTGCAASVTP